MQFSSLAVAQPEPTQTASKTLSDQSQADIEDEEVKTIAMLSTDAERVIMGGTAVVKADERVEKLVLIGGTAEVYGEVSELVVVGGYLKLQDTAKITDDLVLVGGYMDRHPEAQVLGKQVDIMLPVSEDGWKKLTRDLKQQYLDDYMEENQWIGYLSSVIKIFVLMCFAGLGWLFAPGLMRRTSTYLRQNLLWSGVVGIGTTVLILPLTMFLILSLVGIPLLPLQFSLLILFVIFGEIHIAAWLTHRFFDARSFSVLGNGLGLIFLESLSFLPFGALPKWILILVGLGATSRVFNQRLFAKLNDES